MGYEDKKFLRYLVNHFSSTFEDECKKYIDSHQSEYHDLCENIRFYSSIELSEADYQRADVFIRKGVVLDVDLHINAIAIVEDGSNHGYDSEEIYNWITIRFKLNIQKDEISEIETFKYGAVKKRNGIELDDDLLLPKVYNDNVEEVSWKILSRFNKEAIDNVMAIDVNQMCSSLGLKILERKINSDSTIFGQMCFTKNTSKLYNYETDEWIDEEIERNTIILDKKVGFLYSFGSPNLTIAHECVHYVLHKAAFFFARKFQKKISKIQCEVNGQAKNIQSILPLEKLEIQANRLAPLILMPRPQFSKKAKEVMQSINSIYGGNLLDSIEIVIDELATYYNVSKYAVRRRLADIGYEYVLGALNWVDNHYVPPYSFSRGSIKRNETYTISKKTFLSLLDKNNDYTIPILAGEFKFVENHVVVNSPEAIQKDIFGRLQLTSKARNHLDEYALKFSISTINPIDEEDRLGTMCYLCKGVGYEFDVELILDDPNNEELKKGRLKVFMEARDSYLKEFEGMENMEPKDALKLMMDKKGMSAAELARQMHMNPSTISRYLSGETKPALKEAVMICIIMAFPPEILTTFIHDCCGYNFRKGVELDQLYRMFLQGYHQYELEDINDELIESGYEPFYKKE